jgi:hypothetical protein
MSLHDDVEQLAKECSSALEFADQSRALLKKVCSKGGLYAPEGPQAQEGINAYMQVANILFGNSLFASADALLQEWWNDLGTRQLEEGVRFHRATAAHMLSGLHVRLMNHGYAFRWSLLTQADDILGAHAARGGGGKERLRTLFGISERSIEKLTTITESCLEEVKQIPNGWRSPAGFAEEAVQRFAKNDGVYAHQIAQLSSNDDFPISPAYFATLLDSGEN